MGHMRGLVWGQPNPMMQMSDGQEADITPQSTLLRGDQTRIEP
ncbi:hypothetical protein IMCC12053_2716 [Celeribacter marinus]|uniref:Uncharacterized protein n=1 Tax=Celeribacter marinus TaxID=1397108 RepID=A0A0P0A7D0_9RHOB|nr:hypothetical protein IMCC12053_2716 [Celeribacter marinus]